MVLHRKKSMRKALQIIIGLTLFQIVQLNAQINLIDSATNKNNITLINYHPRKIKKAIDIPLTIATAGWAIYGAGVVYNRDTVPFSEISNLSRQNVNGIDRWVSYNYSKAAAKASDYFFVGSMPLPMILFFDKRIRKDALNVTLLYLESVGITGAVYVTSAMLANRFRPYTYNPNVDESKRTRGGARNSFFAGHVAIVSNSVFFTAQTYIDYHPEMKHKWILYTGAGLVASTTGYLRIKAGQHFLTDVLMGATVGTLSGLLVPFIHKNRNLKNQRMTLMPNFLGESPGFTFRYKLGKQGI